MSHLWLRTPLGVHECLELLTGDVESQWAAGAITTEHARCLWNTMPLAAQAPAEHGPDRIDTNVVRAALLERAALASAGTYTPGEAHAKARQPEEGLATLGEAFALVEETDERYCEAELLRLKGQPMLARGNEVEAEASFHKAIEVARRQQAKSWELRATVSLCRLWQQQGRRQEARHRLAKIYDWFTEGFDTPDLLEAKALLEELAP